MRLCIVTVLLVAARAAALGSDKCTWGPSYWCSSVDAASTCNAFSHCIETAWRYQQYPDTKSELCTFTTSMVKNGRHILNKEKNEDQASQLVYSSCKYVRDSGQRKECKAMIEKYLPEIFQLLRSDLPAYSVAHILGLCETEVFKTKSSVAYAPPTNSTICDDCHNFIDDLRKLLNQPNSEIKFENVIENIICPEFGDLEPVCKALVKIVVPSFFGDMIGNDNSEVVCRVGTFCLNNSKLKWQEVINSSKKLQYSLKNLELKPFTTNLQCIECDKVITALTTFKKDSYIRTAMETAVASACSMTRLSEEQCHALSDKFPKAVVSFFIDNVDLTDVCTQTLHCKGEPYSKTTMFRTPLPEPTTDSCQDCQRMFADIKDILQDKNSPPEAAALLKQEFCQSVGFLEFECNKIVDAILPTVMDYLSGVISPLAVCKAFTLCSASTKSKVKVDLMKSFNSLKGTLGDFKCEECMFLVQDARDLDRNPGFQKAIEEFFNGICAKTGEQEEQCKSLVKTYAPQLFEFLASELEPSVVCELLLHCTKPETETEKDEQVMANPTLKTVILPVKKESRYINKKSKKNSAINNVPKVKESVECAICRLAMETIDELIAENRTEEAMTKNLEKLCDVLPSSVKEQCESFVKTYTPAILDLLLQELDPGMICDELQLCKKSRKSSKPAVDSKQKKVGQDMVCSLCQLIVSTVDSIIGQNKSQEVIIQALDDICDILPAAIRSQCLPFVKEYTPVIVQLLIQELSPEQICFTLHLCNKKMQVSVETKAIQEKKLVAGPACDICKLVVQQLDILIGRNRSQEAVEKALEQVCNIFPSTISEECKVFVREYGPDVINLLIQELDPTSICKEIKICTSSKNGKVNVAPPTSSKTTDKNVGPTDTLECAVCKLVIKEINRLIGDNRTEAAIIHAVEIVCNFLSGDEKIACQSEIQNYGPAVIDLLQHMTDPSAVCNAIKLCTDNSVSKPQVKDGEVCLLCEILVTYAGEALKEQTTQNEIEKLLNGVCNILPNNLKAQCDNIVSQFAPMILQLLAQKDDPHEICQAIRLCSIDNASHLKKKGIDVCSLGPAFWCANMNNAKKCGVVEHCIANYHLKP